MFLFIEVLYFQVVNVFSFIIFHFVSYLINHCQRAKKNYLWNLNIKLYENMNRELSNETQFIKTEPQRDHLNRTITVGSLKNLENYCQIATIVKILNLYSFIRRM